MGEGTLIILDDIDTSKLTPAGQAKLLEWHKMAMLRKMYIATVKAQQMTRHEET